MTAAALILVAILILALTPLGRGLVVLTAARVLAFVLWVRIKFFPPAGY